MLRQALLDYMEIERPPWLQNASFGRARVLSFAGSDIAQVFVEADLAHGTDDNVVAFWDAMAAKARGQKIDRLTEIGRRRASLDYPRGSTHGTNAQMDRDRQQRRWLRLALDHRFQ